MMIRTMPPVVSTFISRSIGVMILRMGVSGNRSSILSLLVTFADMATLVLGWVQPFST